MFRFEHPEFLWAFGAIPVLIGFFITMIRMRKRAVQRFGEEGLLLRLMPEFSQRKHTVKFVILMVSLLFLIVAWANPQWGTKKEKVNSGSKSRAATQRKILLPHSKIRRQFVGHCQKV